MPSERPALISRTGPPVPATSPSALLLNESRLLARADTLLQAGDISGARRILEHALAERSGVAAFKLAETYDPRQLAQWQVRGVQADWPKSQGLYERALEAGVAQARQRICQMRSQESCGLGETP